MKIENFLHLMKFPKEWLDWNMIPPELAKIQTNGYQEGHESGAEHDRNGAFHWWLKKSPPPTKEELLKLLRLSFLDLDQIMASDVRKYIAQSPCYDDLLRSLVSQEDL